MHTNATMSAEEALAQSVAATKVEYRQLGRSGLKVLVPILGAMSIGNPAWGPWILDKAQVCRFNARFSLRLQVKVPADPESSLRHGTQHGRTQTRLIV